ncbi:unnamed protein product [Lepidochelys kempii]
MPPSDLMSATCTTGHSTKVEQLLPHTPEQVDKRGWNMAGNGHQSNTCCVKYLYLHLRVAKAQVLEPGVLPHPWLKVISIIYKVYIMVQWPLYTNCSSSPEQKNCHNLPPGLLQE